jgi:beta-glucanase (GH16 family)
MLRKLWEFIFGRKKVRNTVPVPTPEPVPAPAPVKEPTFIDNFSKIDTTKWTISTWTAPGATPTHKGTFLAKNVSIVDGTLCLKLNQVATAAGVTSKGAEIASNEQFHYGTFEWEMRASSTALTPAAPGIPVSGSITGCFIYFDGAQTEIDFEMEGNERNNYTQLTSWVGESNPNEHTKVDSSAFLPHDGFHLYKFVWMPGKIEFYRDNVLIGTHTKVVPSLPAKIMMNHWGTDNINWGGKASIGIERSMYLINFKYTPL